MGTIIELTPESLVEKAAEFLDKIGLTAYSQMELSKLSLDYRNEIRAGFNREQSSLAMIPTQLEPVEFSKLNIGNEALVVEVGGTNIRAARVVVDEKKGGRNLTVAQKKGENSILKRNSTVLSTQMWMNF